MNEPVRRIPSPLIDVESRAQREWIVTNGLGGYASGTVAGMVTRRYHGVLVAALPAPVGRMVMLSHLEVRVRPASDPDGACRLEPPPEGSETRTLPLTEFRLDAGLPIWRFEGSGLIVEKRVLMPHRQNTTHVTYRLVGGSSPAVIEIQPFIHIRHYESSLVEELTHPYTLSAVDGRFEVSGGADLPSLRLLFAGPDSALTVAASHTPTGYLQEQHRGYAHRGTLWSPGYFQIALASGADAAEATLIASTESWQVMEALSPAAALDTEVQRRRELLSEAPAAVQEGLAAELVLAADQFLITPAARPDDAARALALGTEARTVIAGYHWFTDWGRDTMISLEGLTLATGRGREAGLILRTFASYTRDGLIPNMFPDGERQGLYHTADATLWFFHAVGRYVACTGDSALLGQLLPVFEDIIDHHVRGTRFGIGVDPSDGLLRQGAAGYQLTWMDAKVDDWVVTPRRGKAVEINALFYNALCLLEQWLREDHRDERAAAIREHANRLRQSFNARFWNPAAQQLFDVVDGEGGDDPACRPNQLFAIALTYPVLDVSRWPAVLEAVRTKLLTPFGLRTLSPDHPAYRATYDGDLRSRDAAYHQGTVWPWLIGPYVDAWLKAHPDDVETARAALDAFDGHLSQAGIGTISEITDARAPYTPRGCIAQAWSVAEVLRALKRVTELHSNHHENVHETTSTS
jgi:predicted glycogen debranching enzyme